MKNGSAAIISVLALVYNSLFSIDNNNINGGTREIEKKFAVIHSYMGKSFFLSAKPMVVCILIVIYRKEFTVSVFDEFSLVVIIVNGVALL